MRSWKGLVNTLIVTTTIGYMTGVLGKINIPLPRIKPYSPTIDIAQYALYQGNVRSSNLVEGFLPLYQSPGQTLTFFDARFYNPNGAPLEGNIDLGIRELSRSNTQLLGFYGGYDRFRSETRRYYSQLHAGFEYWTRRFFIGGNAYLPIGTKVYDNDAVDSASLVPTPIPYRYNIAFSQGKERVLPGVDAEVGCDFTHGLTIYAGGYYFDHSDASSVLGPKIRATYTFYREGQRRLLGLFDRIRLEGLLSYDSVRGTSWLVGLRIRFGLSHQYTNPSQGLARHMTDTVRRDLNVISENFNLSRQFYMIDGRRARVDLVSNTSSRTIDDAVNGVDSAADIIGIIGPQTASSELTLGDRNLNITGGEYRFSVNGHPYRIAVVGNNGSLTSAGGGDNAFSLVDATGNHAITLQYFTFNTPDDTGFALQTDGNSFGHITVDHIVSHDMPFDFVVTTADGTGSVNFTHNVLDLQNSTAIDGNVGDFAGVLLYTGNVSNQITINQFSDNTIRIADRNADMNSLGGVYIEGDGIIQFNQGFLNNTVNLSNNQGLRLFEYAYCIFGNTVMLSSVSGNTFVVSGGDDTAFAAGWIIQADTTISADVSQNTFIVSDNMLLVGGYGWLMTADMTITGNVTENTFMLLGNNAGNDEIRGWLIDRDTTINGDVSKNTFKVSGNDDQGVGWNMQSNISINGQVIDNNFMINNNNGDNLGILINGIDGSETIAFDKTVSRNQFFINGSLIGNYGFQLDATSGGTIDFNGNSSESELSTSNNNASVSNLGGIINYNG